MKSERDLLDEALGYNYYYNNLREHSSSNYLAPFEHLKRQLPDIDDNIRFVIPFLLKIYAPQLAGAPTKSLILWGLFDEVSVTLGPWSGYNVLAQHLCN